MFSFFYGFNDKLPVLDPSTYFVMVDSVEQSNDRLFVRLDGFSLKNWVENSNNSINRYPSQIFELIGNVQDIKNIFKTTNVHSLENQWIKIIIDSIKERSYNFSQFWNGEEQLSLSEETQFGIAAVEKSNELSSEEKAMVNSMKKLCSVEGIEEAKVKELTQLLNSISQNLNNICVYDVGQGSSVGLCNKLNKPIAYFDVGGGCNSNKFTYPRNLKFCVEDIKLNILSHFDLDHYISALQDDRFHKMRWIVPRQTLTNTASEFLRKIISSGGSVNYWPMHQHELKVGKLRIMKCIGNNNSKNNSGLAIEVEKILPNAILLPGDCAYYLISSTVQKYYAGLAASHHGSYTSMKNVPTAKSPFQIVYSFGAGNTYPHPNLKAISAHVNKKWIQRFDTTSGHYSFLSNTSVNASKSCGCTLNH